MQSYVEGNDNMEIKLTTMLC